MKIVSPPDLHYPITVGELAKQRHDSVARSERLFTYSYKSWVEQGNKWGDTERIKKDFVASFNASVDGNIAQWFIKKGSEIPRAGVAIVEIEEPCTHETQFGGLCVDCGKDMTEVDYLTKELNSNRATVNMTHDNTALLFSHKEAKTAEEESKIRLLESRKLSLIVDLDQTVIHTTCERTIAEWQADPENPNYEAVKDVQGFQLADDNVSNVAANWYYVKMRPGLKDFFDRMSQLYEMHIYTMATRAYAQAVAKIIDPDRRYFGDRILSRDENYTDKLKSLHRLFPNNTNMVVIIDDRADIWQYSDHLIRVPVFNFFPGAGDINASFLPKQQELVTTSSKPKTNKEKVPAVVDSIAPVSIAGKPLEPAKPAPAPAEPALEEALNGTKSELEQQMISMGAGESEEMLEQQVKEQEKVIIAQQTERPLLQQQLVLDKEDEAEEAESSPTPENGESQSPEHHRHRSLLHDDDRGLDVIEVNLRRVHQAFYDEYQKSKVAPKGGRIAELKGERSPKKRRLDGVVPDIAEIMPLIKRETLQGCVICFSGIIPLGMDVEHSDFALWIKSFGAQISLNVDKRTTHVIANPDRKTTKVKKAAQLARQGCSIQIITAEWMFQCCTRWTHVEEENYLIPVEDDGNNSPVPVDDFEDDSVEATGDESLALDLGDDNWKSMADELDDFLNGDSGSEGGSISDSESVGSTASNISESKLALRKRKRGGEPPNEEAGSESDSSATSTSKLQRRKKRTMERVTSLTNVVNADKSGLPSPETTGPEEEQGDEEGGGGSASSSKIFDPQGGGADLDESDYDDGFEAEMMAEFEKSESEGA